MKKIVIICGPTAVGKTALSLELARKFSGEIISADSRQIYKFMNIGTAKPTQKILTEIPHHLINIKNPDEKYTAGDFARNSDKKITEIYNRGHIPFVVGGTGFYIRTLLYGICKTPKIPQKVRRNLQKEISENGSSFFYEKLKKVDPIAAKKIHANDSKRIVRTLEVYRYTGKPLSDFWKEFRQKKRYDNFTIYLIDERKKLYEKINNRVEKMLSNGLLDEIKELKKMGYLEKNVGMNTLGYKELLQYLNKKLDFDEAVQLIKQHMRNYAKRQFTWFAKSKIDLTITASEINLSFIEGKISKFLGK
ncbi:MAG: tRNA (adenosine(37)-N6)-dimethylallyltransferase MiaA [Candidatus Cloacimonetes bacterium]|nr:tRNA (adenosine(37)-N6)-dimethylallyltransferase MiaA [Candidatus Cloacimonadota bacterium]